MNSKKILFIGGGIEGIEGVKWAKQRGYQTVVLDRNPEAPGAIMADEYITASVYHSEEALDQVKSYSYKEDILAVITIGHDAPHTVSKICNFLDLPGPSEETAFLSVNKLAMKERLQERGVPIPWFKKIKTYSELEEVKNERGYPLVMKPVDNRGARGVLKLTPAVNMRWAFDYSMSYSNSKTLIIEEWIDGQQITTESVVWDDKAILCGYCDREYSSTMNLLPHIIEGGSLTPAHISEKEVSDIANVVHRGAKIIGLKRGILKGDVILTDSGPVIIEITSRLSGGYFCTHTIPLAFGINIIEHAMHIAMGIEPAWKELKSKPIQYVVSSVLILKEGIVEKIEFVDDSHKKSWVALCKIYVQKGDRVLPCTNHVLRSALVITTGQEPKEAIERGKKVIRSIKVTLKQE